VSEKKDTTAVSIIDWVIYLRYLCLNSAKKTEKLEEYKTVGAPTPFCPPSPLRHRPTRSFNNNTRLCICKHQGNHSNTSQTCIEKVLSLRLNYQIKLIVRIGVFTIEYGPLPYLSHHRSLGHRVQGRKQYCIKMEYRGKLPD
jgi:hypothetical protein